MRLVFDVDGVVADPTGDYADRKPYPHAVEALRRLKAAGHTLIYQTARYMNLFDGNQEKAQGKCVPELKTWLDTHNIPWDEVYAGKASSDYYVDDKAFRLESVLGLDGWDKLEQELR